MKNIIKLIILFLGIQANLLLCSSMPPHKNLLFIAIRQGDSKAVSDFIENSKVFSNFMKPNNGVNVVNTSMQSSTPLHVAVLNRNPEIVKILLDAGANENAVDAQGKTPLDYTQGIKRDESIKTIINIFHQHQNTKKN